ncbi:MAG TPA: alpha/beta hydrolase-fold protein [Humisphaera sp.]|jgi:enterochelin esterase family protein|nr:alpha/beta hydrolase-fold protein [Humisphaera sp.]
MRSIFAVMAIALILPNAFAQQPATQPTTQPGRGGRGRGPQGPVVISPQVSEDRHVTFRILAPQAQSVRVTGGDMPNLGGQAGQMTKGENGVWEITVGPVDPGSYRYNFNVNGVTTIDPRSPAVSESQNNVWSVVNVPGSPFMDTNDVPHGAVAEIYYHSTALGRTRRMHIYTPPGYEANQDKYPVFYLLHGASDSDDSWTSVGRANFIVDNLIAQKKAKPMIIVMPAGHTTSAGFGGGGRGRGGAGGAAQRDEFTEDFVNDIKPYVEKNYRTINDRAHRAIAGLSMGGGQTLTIAFSHLDQFSYIGVFSSGVFGGAAGNWETQHAKDLDDASLKPGLKVLWFSTGSNDGLITTSKATVDVLKKHGFNAEFEESTGAHTWINWRNYLNKFAPRLFAE